MVGFASRKVAVVNCFWVELLRQKRGWQQKREIERKIGKAWRTDEFEIVVNCRMEISKLEIER